MQLSVYASDKQTGVDDTLIFQPRAKSHNNYHQLSMTEPHQPEELAAPVSAIPSRLRVSAVPFTPSRAPISLGQGSSPSFTKSPQPELDNSFLHHVKILETPGAYPTSPSAAYPPFKYVSSKPNMANQGEPIPKPIFGTAKGPAPIVKPPRNLDRRSSFDGPPAFTTTGLGKDDTQASDTQAVSTQTTLQQGHTTVVEREQEEDAQGFLPADNGEKFRACLWKDWDGEGSPIEAHVVDFRHFPDFFAEGTNVFSRDYMQFRLNQLHTVTGEHKNLVEIALVGMIRYGKKLESTVEVLQTQIDSGPRPVTNRDDDTINRLRDERNAFRNSVHAQEAELKIIKAQAQTASTRCAKAEANLRTEINDHALTMGELASQKDAHTRLAANYRRSQENEAELRQRIATLSSGRRSRSRDVSPAVRFQGDLVDDYVPTRQRVQQGREAPPAVRQPGILNLPINPSTRNDRSPSPTRRPGGGDQGGGIGGGPNLNGRALSENRSLLSAAESQFERYDRVPEPSTYKGEKDDGTIERFIDACELKLEVSYPHWKPDGQLRYVVSRTDELAFKRLKIAQKEGTATTPQDAYHLIKKWFGAHNALLDAQDEMDILTQGPLSLSEFLTKFDHLRLKLGWKDYQSKSELLKKVNRRLQKAATSIFPRDYDDLCDKLHESEHKLKVYDHNGKATETTKPKTVLSRPSTSTNRPDRRSARSSGYRRSAPSSTSTAVAGVDSREKTERHMRDAHGHSIICGRCKEPGHYANQYDLCSQAPPEQKAKSKGSKLSMMLSNAVTDDEYDEHDGPLDDEETEDEESGNE
jgi:hypothetical protein